MQVNEDYLLLRLAVIMKWHSWENDDCYPCPKYTVDISSLLIKKTKEVEDEKKSLHELYKFIVSEICNVNFMVVWFEVRN